MNIRPAIKNDAEKLIVLYKTLDHETSFMLFEPGERSVSLAQLEQHLASSENSKHHIMLVAENENNEIIGFVSGDGGRAKRISHRLHCVIGILQQYHGLGIGRSLLRQLESWARNHNFYRMELTVMEHNSRAISLYEKFGFEREGVKRSSIKIGDQFINEFYMAKLLG